MLVAVLEEDRRRALVPGRARPAEQLVVVGLGQLPPPGVELGVLVDLRLPAARHRGGQVGAVDHRHGAGDVRGELARLLLQGLGLLGEEGRGGVDLGVDARRDAGQIGGLGGDDDHVDDRRPRLEDPRHTDHRHAVGAGAFGQLAAHGGARPRAPGASAASKQASVSSVVPE